MLLRKPLLILLFLPLYSLAQNRYDVVIDEIMADQTPQISLPSNEWLELKNVSANPINLLNWRIGDAAGQTGPMPNFVLQPDSFVIICSNGSAIQFSPFGPTIGISNFPSLDNDAELIYLRSKENRTIHVC